MAQNGSKKVKKVLRKIRRPFEWTGIYLSFLIVPCLTRKGCRRLASFGAHFGMLFCSRDKAVARANLQVIYGHRLTPYREKTITYHCFRNMTAVLVDLFWTSRNSRQRLEQLTVVDPAVIALVKESMPSINISAHIGNWEMLSQTCVLNGVPMMTVMQSIGSSAMTARLSQTRSVIGQKIVPSEGALRHLVYALRHGSSLGLLVDQHTPVHQGGAWLTFFGLPVDVSIGPATLSRKLKVPILVAWSRPLKNGCYKVELLKKFDPDPDVDDITRTQEIISLFETVIRRHPSFWCLNYRRWRGIPAGDDPARYPYYARPELPGREKNRLNGSDLRAARTLRTALNQPL
ncbi:MAG: lysophospholipid acyltransferase family protein [Kiritimatiellae bacterium]|nr:lysophospholipid acyltransferase family protein [Kiritimatiellia bacterium]